MSHATSCRSTRLHALLPLTVGVVVSLCAPGVSGGTATWEAPDASVTIHAQQFRWAGQTFESLDALATTLLPRTPRSVGLLACGTQAAAALLAAVHRFQHLQLHLAVDEPASAPCREETSARPTLASLPNTATPQRIDNDAVQAWWQRRMP